MNAKKLEIELQGFKQACQHEGYISGELHFKEVYFNKTKQPIFIVTMAANKQKMRSLNNCKEIADIFTNIFIKKTSIRACKSLYMLVIKNIGLRGYTEIKIINPNLTTIKINKLFENSSTKPAIRRYINIEKLSKLQIHRLFNTRNKKIIALLADRIKKDKEIEDIVFSFPILKFKKIKYDI